MRDEGPFGDHTGYYTLPEPYPVFHITAITHRKDAVYPSTIVGIPPMEDFYIGGASVKLFLPIFKMNFHPPPPHLLPQIIGRQNPARQQRVVRHRVQPRLALRRRPAEQRLRAPRRSAARRAFCSVGTSKSTSRHDPPPLPPGAATS